MDALEVKREVFRCRFERVLDHHGDRERPHPPGYGGHHPGYLAHLEVVVVGQRGGGGREVVVGQRGGGGGREVVVGQRGDGGGREVVVVVGQRGGGGTER